MEPRQRHAYTSIRDLLDSALEMTAAIEQQKQLLQVKVCYIMSGSPFDPHHPRLPIFHLILRVWVGEGRCESLLRKPEFRYQGSESPGNYSGSSFCPDQVLLRKNLHSIPGCRQKSLVRNSGVGGGGQNLILRMCDPSAI